MKKNSAEVIVRSTVRLCRDPEWTRLGNLASAMECAHHALCTVVGLLEDADWGTTAWGEVMAQADLLYRRSQAIRRIIQTMEDEAIAAAKTAAAEEH